MSSGTTCQIDFFRPETDLKGFYRAKSVQWVDIYSLLGAWSSDFGLNVFVSQVEALVRSDFFGRILILLISDVPNRFYMSIS